MTAVACTLLADLAARGVMIEARNDRLRFSPPSAVPPGMLDALRANKAEILALLAGKAAQESQAVTSPPSRSRADVELEQFARIAVPTPTGGLVRPGFQQVAAMIHASEWQHHQRKSCVAPKST